MGGGYSDLNVYFNRKVLYRNESYNITISQRLFSQCIDFLESTYTIEFTPPADGLRYNVLLYDGYSDRDKGKYLFGYYYPSNDKEIIKEVRTYYSVLFPDEVLVISFTTRGKHIYNCLPDDLKIARWDRAYNITEYSFSTTLAKKDLEEAFRKISRNRKIRVENKSSKEIKGCEQELGFFIFRVIITPSGNNSIIGTDRIFSIFSCDVEPKKTNNKLDEYYLNPFNGKLYDGIIVYYVRNSIKYYKSNTNNIINTPLLLEFVDSSKEKIQIKRRDKDGHWWSQGIVAYYDIDTLSKALYNIDDQAKKNDVNTIFLDTTKTYSGVEKFESNDEKEVYNKYIHEFSQEKNPQLLFKRDDPEIKCITTQSFKTKKCVVYYLKPNKAKKGEQDDKPFLIEFFNDDKPKHAYHFKYGFGFNEWESVPKVSELSNKLNEIEDYASCISQLSLRRWYSYQILKGQERKAPEEEETEEIKRPAVVKPKEKDEGPPIPWIIAGSVGGGVFVISSAIGYGIYWYNTTIKLLT